MDRERQREIARKGGKAAHAKGTAHEFTKDEAREAGRKGGVVVSRERSHMVAIGRAGGRARRKTSNNPDGNGNGSGIDTGNGNGNAENTNPGEERSMPAAPDNTMETMEAAAEMPSMERSAAHDGGPEPAAPSPDEAS